MLLKNIMYVGATILLGASLTNCRSAKEYAYAVTSGGENLLSLTKITDNPELKATSIGIDPSSGALLLSMNEGGSCNIYKKDNPLSPAMSQLTSGTLYCYSPEFNPASNRMVFVYSSKLDSYTKSKNDIYMIDLNRVNAFVPVTQTATINEYSPSISPDGTFVVYQTNSGYYGEIWVKYIKTNENVLLGKGIMPQLSPDGKKIAFGRRKTDASNSPISIWTMNIDGSDVQQITNNPIEVAWNPSWSPDGEKIVFSSEINSNRDLYVINADGTNLIQLTTNGSYEDNPKWSPEGFIYFISDRGSKKGDNQVWRFMINN